MYLRNAKAYIRRHPILTVSSTLSLSLAFLAGLLFVASIYGSQIVVGFFESKAQISAYFKDEAQQADIMVVKTQLEQTGLVANIDYVSKEKAKEFFISQNKEHPEILETLDSDDSNPFPASLEIEAKDINNLSQIANLIRDNLLIEEIAYREDIVDTLKSWTRGIAMVSFVLTGAFMAVAGLVVIVTVGLTIFSKREEIEIMQLLGASKAFIRGPFLLQGGFYGSVAALLSLVYLGVLGYFSSGFLKGFLVGVPFPQFSWYVFVGLAMLWILLGSLVGIFVSLLATVRYLRK